MNATLYLHTQHLDLCAPELLSLGLVAADGHEHYVELDLADPAQAPFLCEASATALNEEVLSQWGRLPGCTVGQAEMARRTGRWMLDQIARSGGGVEIAYRNHRHYDLLVRLLRHSGHWNAIRGAIRPLDAQEGTSRLDGGIGAGIGYAYASRRGLERHHALADAHALRAAWIGYCTGKRVVL